MGFYMILEAACAFIALLQVHQITAKDGRGFEDWENVSNKFREKELVRDKEHLKDHIDRYANIDFDNISPEQLDFLYFQSHDLNKDYKLDGIEILNAIQHTIYHDSDEFADDYQLGIYVQSVLSYAAMSVDKILDDDDTNENGYLEYAEFANSRQVSNLKDTWKKKKCSHS